MKEDNQSKDTHDHYSITKKPPEIILLANIKQYVSQNINNAELSPRYLAKRFGLSLRYLYYLFEKENLSIAKYIKEERLSHARNIIIATVKYKKTTSEIAYSVGFNNISHFCKAFKEKYNETPKNMKQRYM